MDTYSEKLKLIKRALKTGEVSQEELTWAMKDAAQTNNTEALRLLFDAGVDVNTRDKYGRTALYHAAWYGSLDCIKLLLATPGIDVNLPNDEQGDTPLMQAAYYNEAESVKLLMADPRVARAQKNKFGMTAYEIAVGNNSYACMRLLRPEPTVADYAKAGVKIARMAYRAFFGGD